MSFEVLEDDDDDQGDDAAPGELTYEAIVETVAELDAAVLFALVGHVQERTPWAELPPQLQGVCRRLEENLIETDDTDD